MDGFVANGMLMGELSGVLLTLLVLLLFGVWYDRKVTQWGIDTEGFVWLLVVVGVSVTGAGIGILDLFLDWNAGLISLLAFAFSGAPMCYGGIRRYVETRRRLLDLGKHDEP